MLSLLGLSYESRLVNGGEREHKSSGFLEMNPFGQVPVLLDENVTLRDSQAILVYLASRYGGGKWLPQEPTELAQVVAWLSTAANEVARGPNDLRLHHKFGRDLDMAAAWDVTRKLYAVLEHHLARYEWLSSGRLTIADVALYPYVALSPEGLVDLRPYPAISAWLGRVQALPGYVDMPGTYKPGIGNQ
jgi:glutathione S-transferase